MNVLKNIKNKLVGNKNNPTKKEESKKKYDKLDIKTELSLGPEEIPQTIKDESKTKKNKLRKIGYFLLFLIYTFIVCYLYEKYKDYNNSLDFIDEKKNNLYDTVKYPQISLLVPIYNTMKPSLEDIQRFIRNINDQTLKDIEVLFLVQKFDEQFIGKMKNITIKYEKFTVFEEVDSNKNELWNTFRAIFQAKGKFINILSISDQLDNTALDTALKKTFGQIDNYFEYTDSNKQTKLLLKRKILLDIFDEITLSNYKDFNDIVNLIKNRPKPNLNYINLAFCSDNNYIILTYVAILSFLDSKNFNSFYSIYYIFNSDVTEERKNLLLSLYEQYDYFNLTFFVSTEPFKGYKSVKRLPVSNMYRLLLPDLLPQVDKIIYFDGDIINYKDLSNMFNLNFNDNILFGLYNGEKMMNGTRHYYMNNGILLMNLKKMREVNFTKEMLDILENLFEVTKHTYKSIDQYMLRDYYGDKEGLLPIKYHSRISSNMKKAVINEKPYHKIIYYFRRFLDEKTQMTYNEKRIVYNDYDVGFAYRYPYNRHYILRPKPISPSYSNAYKDDWWYFARKSKNYNFIKNFSKKMK